MQSTSLHWHTLVTWISMVRTKWGASPASVLVFLCVRNGDTTSHCMWQYVAAMHHNQYGTSCNVSVILIYNASCVSVSRCGMHCEFTLWFHDTIRLYVWCWNPYSSQWQGTNGQTSVLAFYILDSWKFSGLWTVWVCPTTGMSVIHCLADDNTQCQPTTTIFNTHVATQMAQICL